MGVTPAELELNNGKFVTVKDFTGMIYEGVLHYTPSNAQFPIQIWTNDCCFITFLQIDDAVSLTPGLGCIKLPCCDRCLPDAMILSISQANISCGCLENEAYILEWNNTKQKYEFDYPEVCSCNVFHAELLCSGGFWIVYLALRNKGLTCADGIHLNFPLNCVTLTGTAKIEFTKTGTCACGPCTNSDITVSLKPI